MGGFQSPRIWDYIAANAKDEIEAGGWYNSFDGEAFSKAEMEQYVENTYIKLEPYLAFNGGDKIAVEIGCASGLTMFRIAPYFQKYIGTDMAKINLKRNAEIIESRDINNIELIQCSANEIQGLLSRNWSGKIEIVIMNSVCQYFPDQIYLDDVILQVLKILKPGGRFYIGDVLDKEKLNKFKQELMEYQQMNPDKKINVERKGELWISREYFLELKEHDAVNDVDITNKLFHIENELTKYRYDVIIEKKEDVNNGRKNCGIAGRN